MPDHVYRKEMLIKQFDKLLGLELQEVDTIGFFNRVQAYALQKGVVGSLIEQSVLGYDPDSKQEPDLIVIDGDTEVKTELKSTGMLIATTPTEHYVAKEPMSITAVGVYDLADQIFETSHFWEKLEHMLIVYYLYKADHPVEAYEYRAFPLVGYEFHEFGEIEVEALRADWENVRALVADIVSNHQGPHDKEWKEAVKAEYIERHGVLRRVLNYVDLAPKFPPRFRLKKPIISSMIAKHFGYELEQLPGRYATVSDIDLKCRELTERYKGETVAKLAREFGFSLFSESGVARKGVSEDIVISMFGGTSKKLNQIELFEKFGLIAKTIVVTSSGKRTEDMKLFHVDFDEIIRNDIEDEDGNLRPIEFEDSDLYSYFADHEFLCVMFQEPSNPYEEALSGMINSLAGNTFLGFKRLVFSDEFIDGPVKKLWLDLRDKVINNKLVDVIERDKNGNAKINKSGDISSAPNFMKSKENVVFLRGSGIDSSLIHKTETVNGIKMLPQYVWIKGTAVVEELNNTDEI